MDAVKSSSDHSPSWPSSWKRSAQPTLSATSSAAGARRRALVHAPLEGARPPGGAPTLRRLSLARSPAVSSKPAGSMERAYSPPTAGTGATGAAPRSAARASTRFAPRRAIASSGSSKKRKLSAARTTVTAVQTLMK